MHGIIHDIEDHCDDNLENNESNDELNKTIAVVEIYKKVKWKKYSKKLSMKALAVWIYALVDSIFKIQIVLEWVFQQVIFRSSYYMYIKDSNRSQKGYKGVWRGLKGTNSGQNGLKRV